jgi:WD40 repeat protein
MKKTLFAAFFVFISFELVAQKAELAIPIGHDQYISTIAYTADERIVASGSAGIVKLWNIANGQLLKTIETKANQMNLLVTIPTLQGVGYIADNKFFIVDAPNFEPRLVATVDYGFAPRSIDATKDGKHVFLAGSNFEGQMRCGFIYKINLSTGVASIFYKIPPFGTNTKVSEEFREIQVSPDGQKLMVKFGQATERQPQLDYSFILNTQTGAVEPNSKQYPPYFYFLNDKKILALNVKYSAATNTSEITAKEIATSNFEVKKAFALEKGISTFFHQSAKYLYDESDNTFTYPSGGHNSGYNIVQLDITNQKLAKTALPDAAEKPYYGCVTILPKSKKLLCGGSKNVTVIDGKTLRTDIILGETTPFTANYIRYNPTHDVLLVSSLGFARFFDMGGASGQIKVNGTLMDAYGRINWSPDGSKVAFFSGIKDTFGVLDTKNLGAVPRKSKSPVHMSLEQENLVWTPDSKTFSFGPLYQRGDVNVANLTYSNRYIGTAGYQRKHIYTKNGKYIIVNEYRYLGANKYIGSEDNFLICYDASTGNKVWESPLTTKKGLSPITTLDNDQTLVALSGQDGTFHYINMANGQVKSSFAAAVSSGVNISEAVSIDGTKCAGIANNKITVFDLVKKTANEVVANLPKGMSNVCFIRKDKFLAATSTDNTIHILDIDKKRDIAQIYIFGNSNEWVVTTPEGRFDASQAAQEFMYYVKDGQVIPLASLFEKFYTPKLLNRLLAGETFEPVPVNVNTIKAPPTVKISVDNTSRNLVVADDVASLMVEKDQINLQVQAECPGDAVTEIRLYNNGKLIQTTRNLVVEEENAGQKTMTKMFTVNLEEGENYFKALAFNTQRTESQPAELKVNCKALKISNIVNKKSEDINLHLIVIGIDKYKNPKYNLNYAIADAVGFKEAIEKGGSGIFTKTNIVFINNENATKANISVELDKIKTNATAKDVFIFYYAGHGVMNDKKEFYLVPHDVTQLYGADGALAQKGFSSGQLQQFSKEIKAQKQLFILDACQSAGALEIIGASRGAAEEKAIAQLARATGTHWLTASGSEQFASEFSQLGHGTFTYVLLEALSGKADTGDKKITVKEIDLYLQERVPEITSKYKGTPQYPASYGYGNDFPIIIIK